MLAPQAWEEFGSLVAGFGDRSSAPPFPAVSVRQVHGRAIAVCDNLEGREHGGMEADALVATRPGVLVAVKTADCVPVLLFSTSSTTPCWVAAVHSGWRGTVADIVGAVVADAGQRGHAAQSLRAAIGPSIRECCYVVGDDVADLFRRERFAVSAGVSEVRVDLARANRDLLMRAGVQPEHIEVCAPCTRCEAHRYHSHRAVPGGGRQLSWIGWRG